jgi:DNA replication and repair protein RecF
MVEISKLNLTNFRNFSAQSFSFQKGLNFLFGQNGVGKTNILESLTLLGKSPTLRASDLEEMLKINQIFFTIFAEISNHQFIEKIAINFDLAKKKKTIFINGDELNSRSQDVKNHLINFVFLTPQIEQLFILGKSSRRDYLDKIVCDINFSHATQINSYQKLLRERLIILQKYLNSKANEKWLDLIENQIAEIGTAIAFARIEAVDFFNRAITSFVSNFPKVILKVIGEIEEKAALKSALEIEEFYRQKLRENRANDLENFKTNFGIHRCDFDAIFLQKEMSALLSSTGEQKAIMMSISLARAKISASYKNQATILIFDEVVSHLDEGRKIALFEEVLQNNLQIFASATSTEIIPGQFLEKSQQIFL